MQKIERRIFNHSRTSWEDTNIRKNKNIERTYYRKYKESRSKIINRIAQEIKENVDNGSKISELQRKLEKKVQIPHSITNTEGIKLEIDQIYKRNIQNTIKNY